MAIEEVIGNSTTASLRNHLSLRVLTLNIGKLKWKFSYTLKKVAHVLIYDISVVPSGSTKQTNGNKTINSSELDSVVKVKEDDLQLKKEISIWKDNDYLFKNHIMNGLAEDLYGYYNNYKTAKHVWEALQKKHDTEEVEIKKYVVSRYLTYHMVDERPVETQCHELQKIAHEIITKGMRLDD